METRSEANQCMIYCICTQSCDISKCSAGLPTITRIHLPYQVCSDSDDEKLCLAVTELDTQYPCEDIQNTNAGWTPTCACTGSCSDAFGNYRQADNDACTAVNSDPSKLTDGTACRAVVMQGSLPTCTEAASVADSSDEDKYNCAQVNDG